MNRLLANLTAILTLCVSIACKETKEYSPDPATSGTGNIRITHPVANLMKSNCSSCHNGVSAVSIDFDSLTSMVENDFVRPFDPDNSRILTKSKTGHGELKPTDIAMIEKWITWEVGLPTEGVLSQNAEAAIEIVRRDFANTPNAQKPYIKYLSLHEFSSRSIKKISMDLAIKGVSKAVNMLSQATDIIPPTLLNKDIGLVKINLQAMQISTSEWERTFNSYPYEYENESFKDICSTCGIILARAEFFINFALRAPNYYRFAGIPRQLNLFEKHIGIDFQKSIKDLKVMRSGFKKSGVSSHNRVIERYLTAQKFVWRSYEFNTDTGFENIMNNPLGPPGPNETATDMNKYFTHKGNEFIYQRRNGLMGFYAAGVTTDGSSPAAINETPSVNIAGSTVRVFVGMTCLSCHKSLIHREDEVRKKFAEPGAAAPQIVNQINILYPEASVFAKQMADDNASLRQAMSKLGLSMDVRDPILNIVETYEKVDFKLIANELDVPLTKLMDKIERLRAQGFLPPVNPVLPSNPITINGQVVVANPGLTKSALLNILMKGNRATRAELDQALLQKDLMKSAVNE